MVVQCSLIHRTGADVAIGSLAASLETAEIIFVFPVPQRKFKKAKTLAVAKNRLPNIPTIHLSPFPHACPVLTSTGMTSPFNVVSGRSMTALICAARVIHKVSGTS